MLDVGGGLGDGTTHVGLVCPRDDEVFGAVARRLDAAGVTATFFEPGSPLAVESLLDLSLLVNVATHPESFRALARAERNGIQTWNGYETALLGFKLVGYRALERVGFDVPTVSTTPPEGAYLTKRIVDWHPDVDTPVPVFHQELVDGRPVDYRYYVVDTGDEVRTRTLLTTSKRLGARRSLGLVTPHPFLAAKLRLLLRTTGSKALGVDFVKADQQFWAVDLDPAPSFADVGMVGPLTDSILARLESDSRVRRGAEQSHG